MRDRDFPYVPAWCQMIREMERIGIDIDPFPYRSSVKDRYLYPFGSSPESRPSMKNIFRHEIQNFPDEIILVIEVYDCKKETIEIHLVGSDAVEIICTRKNSHEMTFDDPCLRGSWSDTFQHVFPLPDEVTLKGARSTFRSGIIEVRLKKKQGRVLKTLIRQGIKPS